MIKLASIDNIDDFLADDFGKEQLTNEVHIAQDFLFLKCVEFYLFLSRHLLVIVGVGFHRYHHINISFEGVLNLLQENILENILFIFFHTRLALQEIT